MGGGDLNMKKSFHPHTMQNLERVWKAEQKRDQERKKIDQLRRELQDERAREEMHRHAVETGVIKDREKRLDWMYSGPGANVNREEYLLGKKIDKAVDPFAAQAESESASASAPGGLFASSSSGANSTVDLAAKIKEDPLFMMKKQEEQARKSLMKNPVRLKQLQEILRQQTGGKSHKEKDKKKKKKKKKHSRDDSPESDEDRRHHRPSLSHSARAARQPSHSPSPRRERRRNVERYSWDEPDYRSRQESYRCQSRSRSPLRRSASGRDRDRYRSRSRSRSPRERFSSQRDSRHAQPRSRSPPRSHPPSYHRRRPASPPHRRLNAEELEEKRRQMMEDARSHDKDRLDRIKRRREEAEKEERELRAREKSTDEQFLAPIRASALEGAAASSVEDRIHRNINRMQRTKASLDKNFTQH